MLPPRRQADEHQLARLGAGQRQCHSAHHREGRQQDLPQALAPEARVRTGQEHHPDHGHRLLLCEYTPPAWLAALVATHNKKE